MAWITPKTDWSPNDHVTYEDMNRISSNINHLYQKQVVKADYTENDIVTLVQWKNIVSAISDLAKGLAVDAVLPGNDITASNFNDVEELTLATMETMELIFKQIAANIYVGDDLYFNETPENYTRGV